ncbi:hypothetical protein TRSC58_03507 [Trypanosoma rangeli SC58]|uniref:Uncharacterized protein n=1 Tax=Trypanosoma rangeli SC58 TaxID=429131 RepID=A0A061J383_TRYRA|nr:hypothetical protein TRSC58_03507 [Trypanosoma rangeli SC58]
MFRTRARTAADRGKSHLRSIYDDGKNAVAKSDLHMVVAVVAKVMAAVLLLVNAIFEELLHFTWVKNARDHVQNCPVTQKAEKLLEAANIPKNVGRVPVVGHRTVAAVTLFVNEVKGSMEEMTKQS